MADAWGENNWGEGFWGQQSSITATVTGVESSFTVANAGHTGTALINPTGAEAPAEVGQAIGEAESIYPLTGVQSNTATGTLEAQEGHGVQPTGVEMTFADGTEEIIATVDAGWGRSTWGSFAWNENIEFFANVTGESMSTFTGTVSVDTGAGVIVSVVGQELSTAIGNFTLVTNNIIPVTGINVNSLLQNPTIIADGSVTTSAPGDQMDFAIGEVEVVASHIEQVTGQELSTSLANVTIESRYTVSGISMQFADGDTTETGSAVVTPIGIEMSVIVGNMRSTPWANVVTGASNTWIEVAA